MSNKFKYTLNVNCLNTNISCNFTFFYNLVTTVRNNLIMLKDINIYFILNKNNITKNYINTRCSSTGLFRYESTKNIRT